LGIPVGFGGADMQVWWAAGDAGRYAQKIIIQRV